MYHCSPEERLPGLWWSLYVCLVHLLKGHNEKLSSLFLPHQLMSYEFFWRNVGEHLESSIWILASRICCCSCSSQNCRASSPAYVVTIQSFSPLTNLILSARPQTLILSFLLGLDKFALQKFVKSPNMGTNGFHVNTAELPNVWLLGRSWLNVDMWYFWIEVCPL